MSNPKKADLERKRGLIWGEGWERIKYSGIHVCHLFYTLCNPERQHRHFLE